MQLNKNPYRPITKKDKEKQDSIKKEADAALQELADTAQRVLASDDFARLKMKFTETRDKLISLMIMFVDPDPVKDAFYLRSILNKLDVYNEIIKSVEKNAVKK